MDYPALSHIFPIEIALSFQEGTLLHAEPHPSLGLERLGWAREL